jgi:AcrR family transcriptional regulator
VLRDGSGQNLREYLIATAARLIDQRGSAGLAVRDIAREAKVADGVLYNYFEDKEDLLAHALLAHVGNVMASAPQLLPPPGEGTLAENLRVFIEGGMASLLRVTPAFAGLLSQPKVLSRFHAMVGGDAAFSGDAAAGDGADEHPADQDSGHSGGDDEAPGGGSGLAGREGPTEADNPAEGERPAAADSPAVGEGPAEGDGPAEADSPAGGDGPAEGEDHGGGRGLPDLLTAYLYAEQRLGRIDPAADVDAAASLVVGAIHGQILPRVLFAPPGGPVVIPPDLAGRLAQTVLDGIAPRSPRS